MKMIPIVAETFTLDKDPGDFPARFLENPTIPLTSSDNLIQRSTWCGGGSITKNHRGFMESRANAAPPNQVARHRMEMLKSKFKKKKILCDIFLEKDFNNRIF